MNRASRLMSSVACVLLLVTMIAGVTASPDLAEADHDSGYSVDCYLGNPNQNRNIGTITIFDMTSAGSACNSTFIDCDGKCVGCVTDFDLDGTVCFDKNGKKFLQ